MFHRFAVMVAAAAFAASSVAPAQVPSVTTLVQQPAIQADDVVTPLPAVEPLVPVEPQSSAGNVKVTPGVDDTVGETPDRPIAPSNMTLAQSVAANRSSVTANREIECLAVGIYFESKSEPLAGQLAVGNVIANRAKSHGRFPSSYCGVLFQRGQFSFVHGGGWPPVARSSAQWKTAVAIATLVDSARAASNIGKAMFFHAKRVAPGWNLTRVAAIGNHVFYR